MNKIVSKEYNGFLMIITFKTPEPLIDISIVQKIKYCNLIFDRNNISEYEYDYETIIMSLDDLNATIQFLKSRCKNIIIKRAYARLIEHNKEQ